MMQNVTVGLAGNFGGC